MLFICFFCKIKKMFIQSKRKIDIAEYIFCFVVTIGILLAAFIVYGYAPFGENSLAYMDGSIQYLDFFSYFKDVLSGTNHIGYSFSKTLGGTNIAVFSYYLSSPFSLLVVFFNKADMSSYFDLIVLLKLGVASMTMHYFIKHTTLYNNKDNRNRLISCLLSVCYGLSQYSIAQASNIMWLDGVYMLPLILYGVHKVVVRQENGIFLSVTVGASIIFNWYSGGINCMFSIFFFLFELGYVRFVENKKQPLKELGRCLFQYLFSMLIGVLLSCVLFLPTLAALQNSTRGTTDLSMLLNTSFVGDITSVIQGFSIAGTSAGTTENVEIRASLFCGTIVIVGCFALFLDKKVAFKQKIYYGIIIILIVLFLYWQPFEILFSLLKYVSSYWIRYSYVGIFALLWIASQYYLNHDDHSLYAMILAGFIYAIVMVYLNYRSPEQDVTLVRVTAVCMCLMGLFVGLLITIDKKELLCIGSSLMVIAILIFELYTNARFLMQIYHSDDAIEYKQYSTDETLQINRLKEKDYGIYRVSQTATRRMEADRLTANYDEAFAYNYWSISGYTSSPDDNQRDFLEKLGYRKNGDNFNVVSTPIISTDSLLGVKYLLSDLDICEYNIFDEEVLNNKKIYENPYVLPMAFKYIPSNSQNDYINPFEYQNELYSELVGEEVDLYVPLNYTLNAKEGILEYKIQELSGNYAYYGNLPWRHISKTELNISNTYTQGYSCWRSPSVFYIPNNTENGLLNITVSGGNIEIIQGEEQFYALDLDVMKEIKERITQKEAKSINIENGKIDIIVEASEGEESLYLAVPYDRGWDIVLNGKKLEAKLFADCMYSIPLEEGINTIEMTYHIPMMRAGLAISTIGVLLVLIQVYLSKR